MTETATGKRYALQKTITVFAEFRAQHRWKECPFEEQAFLRDWHRHVFKVWATFTVSHSDRDLEFFVMQEHLRTLTGMWEGKQVEKSCEMFAESIIEWFLEHEYPITSVGVSEDGENVGTVTVLEEVAL